MKEMREIWSPCARPGALKNHFHDQSMLIDIIANITLLINIAVAFYFYKMLEPRWLRLFAWFLIITLLTQAAGSLYSNYTYRSNHFIFNIYIGIEYLFYFFLFYRAFNNKKMKYLIVIFAMAFVVFYVANIFFGKGLFIFNTATYTLGSILTIISCLLYFVFLFLSNETINYFRMPMFWIATGLLFYYVGDSVYMSLLDYIVKNNIDNGGHVYAIITVILNLLLYVLFTFGFLSNRPWKRMT